MVKNPIVLRNNARSHTASAVIDHLLRWKWEILEHPPYSPDISFLPQYCTAIIHRSLYAVLSLTSETGNIMAVCELERTGSAVVWYLVS